MTLTPLLTIRVHGEPKGQPRARAFAVGGKARMYDPGTAEGWKSCVAMAAQQAGFPDSPAVEPIRLSVTFLFPRPGRLNKKSSPPGRIPHTAKPDIDNALKAVMDCLTQIGVWCDDKQVSLGECPKFYAAKGEKPGAEIRIEVLKGTP